MRSRVSGFQSILTNFVDPAGFDILFGVCDFHKHSRQDQPSTAADAGSRVQARRILLRLRASPETETPIQTTVGVLGSFTGPLLRSLNFDRRVFDRVIDLFRSFTRRSAVPSFCGFGVSGRHRGFCRQPS